MTIVRSFILPQIEPGVGSTSPPLITTTSLPSATQGTPYSFQMSAVNGVPPYSWSLPTTSDPAFSISSSGVLGGTTFTVETAKLNIQVTDSLSTPTAPTSFDLSVQPGSTQGAPSAMWPSYVDSTSTGFIWWYPTGQTSWTTGTIPNYYKIYRNGTLISMASPPLTNPGVTADSVVYGHPLPLYFDTGLTPNTTYNYNVTAVYGTQESGFGPTLTATTLANGAAAPPAPATDPATWIVPYALPTGGTTWTATNTTAGLIAGTGTNNATGCSFPYALAHADIAGGDIIVLTAGATYTAPGSGYTIPAFTGANGWTYIISSEDPVFKPGGKLPAYSYNSGSFTPTVLTLTAAPTAGLGGSTSATLAANQTGLTDASGNWLLQSGWFYVTFNSQEQRKCVFTNGSSTISWSANNGLYTAGAVTGFNLTAGGVGYAAGQNAIKLAGGHGAGAVADSVGISGGAVNSVSLGPPCFPARGTGGGYQVGDVLTMAFQGGTGASITVTSVGGTGAALAGVNPFTGATVALNPTISADVGNFVTGWDRDTNGAMPILQWNGVTTSCFNTTGGGPTTSPANSTTNVRFVGIGMAQDPTTNIGLATGMEFVLMTNTNPNNGQGAITPCESLYFDRCCFGTDTEGAAWIPAVHSFTICCNHFLMHQCYIQGVNNGPAIAGDTNTLVASGGPSCFQNSYLEAGSETIEVGGIYAPQNYIPHDIVLRNSFSHKPLSWAVGSNYAYFGHFAKNLFELKVGIRVSVHDNLFRNCWQGQVPGYHAPPMMIGAREQVSTNAGIQTGCPWNTTSDVDAYNNLCYNTSGFYAWMYDFTPASKTMRVRFRNNLVYISPPLAQQDFIYNLLTQGPAPDIILDHNTFILNSGLAIGSNPQPVSFKTDGGGVAPGTYANPSPYAPNPWHTFGDRLQITNNLLACGGTFGSFLSPSPPSFAAWPNISITNNLTLGSSATTYPGLAAGPSTVLYPTVPYSSIGFAVPLVSDKNGPPLHPSDWNITTGTYATASTTGGPLGYISPPPLFLGNSLQGISTSITSSDSQDTFFQFTGTDGEYGNQLPRAAANVFLFGGTGGNDQVQQTCTSKLASGYSADIVESIATDNTVPAGVSSTVRVSTLVNPYDNTVHTQNSYLVNPGSGTPTMVYVSHWIWLQADMTSRTNSANHFGEFVEFKTGPGNTDVERFQIGYEITANPSNNWTGFGNTPVFIMTHDQSGSAVPGGAITYVQSVMSPNSTQSSWGIGQTHAAPIPLGAWFKLEWAFNRNDSAGQGWMWAALTIPSSSDPALQAGVQFFAARGAFSSNGQTLGFNMALPSNAINRIFIDNTNYTDISRSSSSTYVVKTTDYQVYAGWPTTASAHPGNYR